MGRGSAISVLRRLDAGTELSGLVRLTAGRVLAEELPDRSAWRFSRTLSGNRYRVIGEARVVSLARREGDIALALRVPQG